MKKEKNMISTANNLAKQRWYIQRCNYEACTKMCGIATLVVTGEYWSCDQRWEGRNIPYGVWLLFWLTEYILNSWNLTSLYIFNLFKINRELW